MIEEQNAQEEKDMEKDFQEECMKKTEEETRGRIYNLSGEVELPRGLFQTIQEIKEHQRRLEAKMDLIISALECGETPIPEQLETEKTPPPEIQETPTTVPDQIQEKQRLDWGDTPEEKRIKIYEIIARAVTLGIPIRTTAMKKAGGKFSSAISYAYKFFDGGWKEAKDNFNEYDGDLERLQAMEMRKKEE